MTYRYDALGRLVATASTSGPTSTIGYDPAGNRTSYAVTGGGGGGTPGVVADASFEQPPLGSDYAVRPAVAGVAFAGNTGVAGNNSAWEFVAAPDGTQAAFFQGSGTATPSSITLSVSGLTVGASYTVSFYTTRRTTFAPNPLEVRIGGTLLGTYTPGWAGGWDLYTTPAFQATAATTTLEFRTASNDPYLVGGLDKVAINAVP